MVLIKEEQLPILDLWKKTRTSHQSYNTWNKAVLEPLIKNNLVIVVKEYMSRLTDEGKEVFYALDGIDPTLRSGGKSATPKPYKQNMFEPLDVKRDMPSTPLRPNSQDFLQHPSLVNGHRIYRKEANRD